MRKSLFAVGRFIKKALMYLRHSLRDSQEYSVAVQRERIQKFAAEHDIEIIGEVIDEESGLTADRDGFQNVIQQWVLAENAPDFDYILVYDMDRWARFQNPNEWGYYGYLCDQHKKQIVDISLGIPREDHPMEAHVMAFLKQEAAADFSRKLSERVWLGSMKVSQEGYSTGGSPCYGMARWLLDIQKNRVRKLKPRERKQTSNERVIFVPLWDDTTKAVVDMFHLFVEQKRSFEEIAMILNDRGSRSAMGGLWNERKIIHTLTNEIYRGTRVYNKTWKRLKQKPRNNPRSEWVIRKDAFDPVVSHEVFEAAQQRVWSVLEKQRPMAWIMERARVMILQSTRTFLAENGFDEDAAFEFYHNFPLVLSTSKRDPASTKEWCFVLPEGLRKYGWVIGVGIVADQANPVDQWFMIPTENFGIGGICAFSERDQTSAQYTITTERLMQELLTLAKMWHASTENQRTLQAESSYHVGAKPSSPPTAGALSHL